MGNLRKLIAAVAVFAAVAVLPFSAVSRDVAGGQGDWPFARSVITGGQGDWPWKV